MSPEARAAFESLAGVAREGLAGLPKSDAEVFMLRLERYWQDLFDGLKPPYGARDDSDASLERLVRLLAARYAERPEDLKALDLERNLTPDWFQSERRVGYVFYADRFAGDLAGVADGLDYLEELGANYVHVMPLLRSRPAGLDDGGYAVSDYRKVQASLGTMEDLRELCARMRGRGMSLCLDLVLNHCAREHEWAEGARRGIPEYEEMFHVFGDRTLPDEYEKTLPEVFPETAPGNFTLIEETGKWVWTTFNDYQWDLNWSNPRVFLEMADVLLSLANVGVEVFRLDAVAFMWKELGTSCQNRPEVHDLLQALRACSRISCAAVVHKAEAIVGPDELVTYLGTSAHHGKESDLAYHNALMVHLWSSLASRDARLMAHALGRFPRKPANAAWATYARGHDDIGWAITDEDASAVGLDAGAHRSFLSDFYSGGFPGSHARGAVFEQNPATGDRRISGTLAGLAGLELAQETGDEALMEMSVRRVLLCHALIFGYGGIPLIYMGDELGLAADHSYLEDPNRRDDNRWMHRPRMDWRKAARRHSRARWSTPCSPASAPSSTPGGVPRTCTPRRRSRSWTSFTRASSPSSARTPGPAPRPPQLHGGDPLREPRPPPRPRHDVARGPHKRPGSEGAEGRRGARPVRGALARERLVTRGTRSRRVLVCNA
nr:alpha-amylase family protein [Rubrobacter marinus]